MDDDDPFPDPVELPIEDALDLHPFGPREIPDVVTSYLASGLAARTAWTRRRCTPCPRPWINRTSRNPAAAAASVERFADAAPQRGGWGATVVVLVSQGDR